MRYLSEFSFLTLNDEESVLNNSYRINMSCYNDNVYPFRLIPNRGVADMNFDDITILYGGNGSGKSTMLNIIAEKLKLNHTSPINKTDWFDLYVSDCDFEEGDWRPPYNKSKLPATIIRSDDVFSSMLENRGYNDSLSEKRQELSSFLFEHKSRKSPCFGNLKENDRLDRLYKQSITKSLKQELGSTVRCASNGESALAYFLQKMNKPGLYLLDEPENSLSAEYQIELLSFLEKASLRDYQLIIATHSPFILSLRGAKIYDISDETCRVTYNWCELDNMKIYHTFFSAYAPIFELSSAVNKENH